MSMDNEAKPGDTRRAAVLAYHGPRSCAVGVIIRDGAGRYWCDREPCRDLAHALAMADAAAVRRDAMTA